MVKRSVGLKVILVSLLKEPINRGVYDFIIRSPHVVSLFDRYGCVSCLVVCM